MTDIIAITYNEKDEPVISGRELHERLEIETQYTKWFNRMCEYGFEESKDYALVSQNCLTNNPKNPTTERTDHVLTLDMAKQLCMIQRTEKGRMFREYFIEVEKAWNSEPQIMARAMKIMTKRLDGLTEQVKTLEAENSQKTVELAIAQPKAEYFDALVDRNLLTSFRDTAKLLHINEKSFVKFLLSHEYVYRDKNGKLCPYSKKNDGLFEIKECYNEKTDWRGTQTLITPKGRETFRLLCEGL